jgi:hypothetical protein
MDYLSLEEINDAMANTRTRGGYASDIRGLVESGEVALNVLTLAQYKDKEAASVYNSFNLNITKLKEKDATLPELRCIHDKKGNRVILINVTALKAAESASTDEG